MEPSLKSLYDLEKAKHKARMELIQAESELRKKEIELKKEAFKGNDGYTPIKGKDYFTEKEIKDISQQILVSIPKPKDGNDAVVDYEKILTVVYSKINEAVSKIPTKKGDKGDKGDKGEDGNLIDIDINALAKSVLSLIKKDKSLSIDYKRIFTEMEKQVHRVRENMPVGSSNSLKGLIDADLTGVPQDAKGTYLLGLGGGSGTPASTVTSETSFGASPAVGSSTEYARADHTHGTPPDPIPAHLAALDPHPQYALDAQIATLQEGIQFRDEGVALGAPYTVNEIDFVGSAVNAVRVGNKITVTITGGGGSVTLTEIEVDMGNKSSSKRFTVPDAAVTPSSRILVFPSPNQATGRKGNDWELDSATLTALAASGSFQLSVLSPFRMRGYRKLYYQVV